MRDLRELNLNEGGQPVSRPAPTAQEIEQFESALGVSLPESYLRLLRHANGGHPELDSFVPKGHGEEDRWSVNAFYHLGPDREDSESVWLTADNWRSVLGDKAVPIAEDGGGNQLYLDFSTREPCVKLHIHDAGVADVHLADSFESFVDMLHEDPDMI